MHKNELVLWVMEESSQNSRGWPFDNSAGENAEYMEINHTSTYTIRHGGTPVPTDSFPITCIRHSVSCSAILPTAANHKLIHMIIGRGF